MVLQGRYKLELRVTDLEGSPWRLKDEEIENNGSFEDQEENDVLIQIHSSTKRLAKCTTDKMGELPV